MSGNRAKTTFFEGVGHFQRIFDSEGASATKHCWCQKIRLIAVSCGIKISAVHHLVLSQYTRLTDRQTDGQTDRQTELRQQYSALHCMAHGKNCLSKLSAARWKYSALLSV